MISIIPVILAGGSGTRLWPLSREEFPKQLLRLSGASTLLQETALRMDGLAGSSRFEVQPPIVSCNEEHRFLTLEQLEAVDHAPQRIVLEPSGRNTAPALTAVALTVTRGDTDPVLLVMPADHVIANVSAFQRTAEAGCDLANKGYVVTFGVVPTHPDTGYGYIRTGDPIEVPQTESHARVIAAFVEKPDLDTA